MRKALIRWRFLLHLLSPPFAPPQTVIFCRFLRAWRKQKIPISLGNQDFTVFCFSSKWCHQESNRGHKDFQSFALPTELWHHPSSVCHLDGANLRTLFVICNSRGDFVRNFLQKATSVSPTAHLSALRLRCHGLLSCRSRACT